MAKASQNKAASQNKKASQKTPPSLSNADIATDTGLVERLAEIARTHDLSEVVFERDGLHIRVARQAAVAAPVHYTAAAPAVVAPPPVAASPVPPPIANADAPGVVKSPMVGTAYRRPSPEAKPFVEIGSLVKAGEKIMLIEAMKTFNDIVAPRSGTITAIFIDDTQPVEYGEALLTIE